MFKSERRHVLFLSNFTATYAFNKYCEGISNKRLINQLSHESEKFKKTTFIQRIIGVMFTYECNTRNFTEAQSNFILSCLCGKYDNFGKKTSFFVVCYFLTVISKSLLM